MAYSASPRRATSPGDELAAAKEVAREDLFRMWVASIQGDAAAEQQLRRLASKNTAIESALHGFEEDLRLFNERHRTPPKRRIPVKPKKPRKGTVVRKVKGRAAKPPREVPDSKRPLGGTGKPPASAWEHMTEGVPRRVSVVSGGLPTLGKRR